MMQTEPGGTQSEADEQAWYIAARDARDIALINGHEILGGWRMIHVEGVERGVNSSPALPSAEIVKYKRRVILVGYVDDAIVDGRS